MKEKRTTAAKAKDTVAITDSCSPLFAGFLSALALPQFPAVPLVPRVAARPRFPRIPSSRLFH